MYLKMCKLLLHCSESYADIMGLEYKELEDNVPPKNDIIDLNFYQHDTAKS